MTELFMDLCVLENMYVSVFVYAYVCVLVHAWRTEEVSCPLELELTGICGIPSFPYG